MTPTDLMPNTETTERLPLGIPSIYSGFDNRRKTRRVEYTADHDNRVRPAIEKTRSYFMRNQHPDGYWWFELESNTTITAEYLMLLHFIGMADKERDEKIAGHLLKQQRADGTWAIHKGGKGDISTTVEAYLALKLAGFSANDPRLAKARGFIVNNGGVGASRVFTKIFLALFGQFDWQGIPSVPVEIVLLPTWFPLNIYNFSSWARATFVPLSVVLDAKPVKPVPEGRGIGELYPHGQSKVSTTPASLLSWKGFFALVDKFMKATDRSRLRYFRKRGLQEALYWTLKHQEETGDWGGIQPAMVYSILALTVQGYDLHREPVRKGLDALQRFTIEREDEMLLQSCISPVWDTALTGLALSHSGTGEGNQAMAGACRWLADNQISRKGDWSVKRPSLEPGGWAFEFKNDWYPDIDDTAVVLMLLTRPELKRFLRPENLDRAVKWMLGMQGKDGGWGAFDADNDTEVLNHLPFGDLEAMIDPSTPDITGRVLELLGCVGYPQKSREVKAAFGFLRKCQEKDGLWWGRWGVNYSYGTWSVLAGLNSIGEDMAKPYVRKAVETLKRHQNPDGGWGECCESYADPRLRLRGKSTPSQTAWVIMALLAAGDGRGTEAARAVDYLLKRQKEDGTWEEEEFTATGFPKHFMIRYHNYRNCFPLMALGKYLRQFEKARGKT
jgi:squalene-hopene/tetraprenyl-beta-curcumene cyclase